MRERGLGARDLVALKRAGVIVGSAEELGRARWRLGSWTCELGQIRSINDEMPGSGRI